MADRPTPPPSAAALRCAALRGTAPEIHFLPAGAMLWRVYFRTRARAGRWNGFRSFGSMGTRFDHHPPPHRRNRTRAILYASDLGPTCLAEVFQDTRVIDRFADTPELVAFRITRDLQLLDMTGAWPTRAGASMAINSGSRALARRWSRAIYSAYPQLARLRYASSMNANQPAFALYERARSSLPAAPAMDLRLTTPGLAAVLAAAATRSCYALL